MEEETRSACITEPENRVVLGSLAGTEVVDIEQGSIYLPRSSALLLGRVLEDHPLTSARLGGALKGP